ncbi:LysR family transcriptional regulator [Rhodococcus sp. P1Y]|uniref:LysR family transcriptional regulator n=1 Tax=Rhodococcus sp. P1Y TaxID=1302308 RepID=UPI000EB2B0BB|nr:LysR family transcriptional regulator [Rhodococcus sp. P1Y]AYJ47318.1 LysR family transcriptional regulator [Rhodococcus sp. P1Y]
MEVELRHLRALVALADCGTHTAAAAELRVSQPTLTRSVRQLEQRCGRQLIESRSADLTEDGLVVLARARRIVREVDALIADLDDHPVVRLGFAWLLPDQWFAATRDSLVRQYDADVDVRRVDDPLAALDAREVDVALYRNRPHHLTPGTVTRQVGTERRILAVSRSNLSFGDATEVRWDALPPGPLVVNTLSGSTTADSIPVAEDGEPRVVITCRNFEEWLEIIAAGRGIGIVPELAARRISHPGLRFLPIDGAPPTQVRLAWRDGPMPPRAVQWFLDVAFTEWPRARVARPAHAIGEFHRPKV